MRSLTPNQVLAYNVKRLREEHEWSLRRLAEAVNRRRGTRWTKQTVLKVEEYDEEGTVGRKVSIDELVALANVFQVSVIELLLPPDTIKNEATNEVEEVGVDLGPLGIRDWKEIHDKEEYAASAFHFPTSQPNLSTLGFWAELGDQILDEEDELWRDVAKMTSPSAEEQLRKIEELVPSIGLREEDKDLFIQQRMELLKELVELFPTGEELYRRFIQLEEEKDGDDQQD